MPRVDFYIVEENHPRARLLLACRLVEKAYKNKHSIYVHAESESEAHDIDELLWTYRDDSFLPHNLYGEGPDPAPPIQIGFAMIPEKHRDILLNLNKQIPKCHDQFSRILEIVTKEEEIQTAARERFKQYRIQNYVINTHKLQTVE